MHTPPHFLRNLALVALLFSSQMVFAQSGPKWATDGNATTNSDFIGTTNTNWLFFRTNNIPWMSLSTTGVLQLNSYATSATGLAWFDTNGNLMRTNFPNDPNQVLTGTGTFNSISNLSGWKIVGNDIFNLNSGFVGIGTITPQYLLDVNGDARVNGTLYALGLVLATKMQADTMKSTNMISVNNNLNFTGGLLNEIYTFNGDVRLQSRLGYNGNTILNAGTSGNVGVGIYSPQYKFDVNGTMRVSGAINFSALAPPTGYARLYIDSTGTLRTSNPSALACTTTSLYDWNLHGNYGTDPSQDFIGTCDPQPLIFRANNFKYMRITGTGNIGIGNFDTYSLAALANTFIVGFNSDIPTLYVGPGNGAGTTGDVGIGMSAPQYKLDVCGTIRAKEMRVNTTGCDFVFDSTYFLMPMDSLSLYLEEKKHLPGIPTAAQMETEDGVALGQLNSLYLMKIEELTLYMLLQQKQIEEMQRQINELKSK